MNGTTVCAIVLDYRAAEKTEKCLLSLVGQGLRTAYVLDNSADVNASNELRQAIERVERTDPDFTVVALSAGENLGFARGVNYVLGRDRHAESPHDYYLLLNNDAMAGPGLVAGMLARFLSDPDVVLVAPRILSSDPTREFGIWYHRYFGLLFSRPGIGRFHYFTGCCLLLRKNLVTESGLFDESFFMYGEDAELGWRLLREGKKTTCANEVYVEHEYGPSVNRVSFFYEYHMVRGHLLLSVKAGGRPAEIPFLIPAKYFALAGRALIRSIRYRTLIPVSAFLKAGFFKTQAPRPGAS